MAEQPEQTASKVEEPQTSSPVAEEPVGARNESKDVDGSKDDVEMTDAKNDAPASAEKVNGSTEATVPVEDAPEDVDAAADDSKKARRKSSGAPEKGQKRSLFKKKSTANIAEMPDPEVGEYRLGRVKGYPAWPCIICEDEMLPDNLLLKRPVGAKRPDGIYRPEFADGGKKAHERSFPVMFLFTNDFGWLAKANLDPLDQETAEAGPPNAKAKGLADAYRQAAENQPLEYFKDLLSAHEAFVAEKEAKKAAKGSSKKGKAKSAEIADEMDIDEDVEVEADATKSSKKRKKDVDSDGETEKPAKTPKRKGSVKALASGIKLKLTTPKEPKKSEPKEEKKASTKKAKKPKDEEKSKPTLTPEEQQKQKDKPVLWFRHQLQRRFLNTNSVPADEDIGVMNECITKLEENPDLEATTIRNTKIHKVLKGIIKLNFIPKDEEFSFKQRAHGLLQKWKRVLSDDPEGAGEGEQAKVTNGDSAERSVSQSAEPKTELPPAETTENADAESKEPVAEKTESAEAPVTEAEKTNGVTTEEPKITADAAAPEETEKKADLDKTETANHDKPIETLKAAEPIEAAS